MVHKFIMPASEKMVKFHSYFFPINTFFSSAYSKGFYFRMLSKHIGTVQDVGHKKSPEFSV